MTDHLDQSEITSLVDLYESEIPKIEMILQRINKHVFTRMYPEDLADEIIGRFHEIGLKVKVVIYEGVDVDWVLKVSIEERLDANVQGFDHEKMAWEVQHAILGIDAPGAMSPSGLILPPKSVSLHSSSREVGRGS